MNQTANGADNDDDVDDDDFLFEDFKSLADTDVFVYVGRIDESGANLVRSGIEQKKAKGDKRASGLLILATPGGSADAAFNIARAFQNGYDKFTLAVGRSCKSAGTLICAGAQDLVMDLHGEIGPLDVQVAKRDEAFEWGSGLDLLTALDTLADSALAAFRRGFLDIRVGGGLSTRVAADIASNLAVGLFAPIFAQVDPVRIGELTRKMQIAHAYAVLLDSNAKNLQGDDALAQLVSGYPSHGFIIDIGQARELFHHVREPSQDESTLLHLVRPLVAPNFSRSPAIFRDVRDVFESVRAAAREHVARARESGDGNLPEAAASGPHDDGKEKPNGDAQAR